MINFYQDLIAPVFDALNLALESKNNGAYIYEINDVPRNYRYKFSVSEDTGEYEHAYTEAESLHKVGIVPICGVAMINPVSLEGTSAETYNAMIDSAVRIIVPLNRMRGTVTHSFTGEIRRLIDTVLQASQSRYITNDGIIYQVNTRFSVLQTGDRAVRGSAGDSIEFTIYLSFGIVSFGISSDDIQIFVDGEKIFTQRLGLSRKSVKEMGIPSGDTSQKSFETGTLFVITFDTPARMSENGQSTSFNEKIADFVIGGENPTFNVRVEYPEKQVTDGIAKKVGEYTMKFDTVGINGETGLASSHSVTLMEV